MALLGNVVVRRPGEPEVYAETRRPPRAVLPGNPGWGHPPLEDEVRMADEGWDWSQTRSLLGPTTVRWYPAVQWLDGDGFADLLRSTSLYRGLYRRVRESLLDASAERIRTRMGDRASRRYLSVLRAGQHAECHSGGGSLIQLRGPGAVAARPTATLCAVSDQGQFSWSACARTDPDTPNWTICTPSTATDSYSSLCA